MVTGDTVLQLGTLDDATFNNLTIDPGATLEVDAIAGANFNDITAGDGATFDGILLLRGVLTPTGTLTVDGELEMEDTADYVYQLGGLIDGLVSVTADGFIDGKLTLQAVGPLANWGDHSRTVLETVGEEGEIIGEFAEVPAAGDHLGYGVFHQAVRYPDTFTSVEVDLFQAAAGDTNADKSVDIADLQNILAAGSFGSGTDWTWGEGDFNNDGLVNISDLQAILATGQFGAGSYAAAAPAAAVPEPGTLLMLAGAALGLLLWRRRKTAA